MGIDWACQGKIDHQAALKYFRERSLAEGAAQFLVGYWSLVGGVDWLNVEDDTVPLLQLVAMNMPKLLYGLAKSLRVEIDQSPIRESDN